MTGLTNGFIAFHKPQARLPTTMHCHGEDRENHQLVAPQEEGEEGAQVCGLEDLHYRVASHIC